MADQWTNERVNALLRHMDNIANELYVLNNQTLADITKVVIHPKPPKTEGQRNLGGKQAGVSHVADPRDDVCDHDIMHMLNRFDQACQDRAFMGSDHPDTWADTKTEYADARKAIEDMFANLSNLAGG